MEEKEEWKDVGTVKGIDFTGLCQVSTFGNVKFLDRWVEYKNGYKRFYKEELKKPRFVLCYRHLNRIKTRNYIRK